jgi:hypothetical protein
MKAQIGDFVVVDMAAGGCGDIMTGHGPAVRGILVKHVDIDEIIVATHPVPPSGPIFKTLCFFYGIQTVPDIKLTKEEFELVALVRPHIDHLRF